MPLPEPMPLWLSLLLGLVAAPVLALGALAILHKALDRLLRDRHAPVLRRLLRDGRAAVRVAVALLALIGILPELDLPGQLVRAATGLADLALIAALGWLLTRKVAAIFDAWLDRAWTGEEDWITRRHRTQMVFFRRLAIAAGVTLTAGLVLTQIPAVRAVGLSLFASAGVAGIVAGLAARPAVSNLIAGIQLALTQPIRIGDSVVIEGDYGTVDEITATYVTITTWDLRSLVVPLNYFMERPIRNWTKRTTQLLDTVFVHVDYTVPVEAIRVEAQRILDGTPLWDRRVFAVQVTDLKERSMEVRVLMSASNAGRMFDLRCLVREALIGWLAARHPNALPQERIEMTGGRKALA
ncbi:MAG TPA: mechanosensitive ion channel domain-containing protein [Acetobacteraceae bacterium]